MYKISKVSTTIAVFAVFFLLSACETLFPKKPGKDLAHFTQQAPQQGVLAPDFELTTVDGKLQRLSDFIGKKPVVLQFGSHSCPVYRYRRFSVSELQNEFDGRVEFVTVYTQEAHPKDSKSPYRDGEWLTWINRVAGVKLSQPQTLQERISRAQFSNNVTQTQSTVLVDAMNNNTWQTWGAAPSPAFVINVKGEVVLAQPWVNPREIRKVLNTL